MVNIDTSGEFETNIIRINDEQVEVVFNFVGVEISNVMTNEAFQESMVRLIRQIEILGYEDGGEDEEEEDFEQLDLFDEDEDED